MRSCWSYCLQKFSMLCKFPSQFHSRCAFMTHFHSLLFPRFPCQNKFPNNFHHCQWYIKAPTQSAIIVILPVCYRLYLVRWSITIFVTTCVKLYSIISVLRACFRAVTTFCWTVLCVISYCILIVWFVDMGHGSSYTGRICSYSFDPVRILKEAVFGFQSSNWSLVDVSHSEI